MLNAVRIPEVLKDSYALTNIPIGGSGIAILDDRKIHIAKHAFELGNVVCRPESRSGVSDQLTCSGPRSASPGCLQNSIVQSVTWDRLAGMR